MKLTFKFEIKSIPAYRDIKYLQREIEGKKKGLRYIRKEKVKSREKQIYNLEKRLSRLQLKRLA